jgi:HAD superfamily phosphatase (TIGR01668 family)
MRSFRAGTYEREKMPRALRHFSPSSSLDRVEDVDLGALKVAGKSLVLLDVDNTLLPWREYEFPQSVLDWLERGKRLGLEFCILSNTRHPERLQKISETIGVPFIRGKFKPSRKMYLMALEKYGKRPEEAVMLGDQLLTDVLGANRSGIDAVWIRPVAKREFIGTRIVSRNIERLIGKFLFDYVEGPAGSSPGLFRSDLFKQIVKFCFVGGSSFIIDYCIKMTLRFAVPYGGGLMSEALGKWLVENISILFAFARHDPVQAAVVPISIVAAGTAIVNSFVWNRRWTFRIVGKDDRASQFGKFLAVSLVGLGINTVLTTLFALVIPGGDKMSFRVAIVLAAAVTAFWNFTGQRLYAFKKK